MSKSNDAEKENFLARFELLPLTSRSRTDRLTDNCKISIMMIASSVPLRKRDSLQIRQYIGNDQNGR